MTDKRLDRIEEHFAHEPEILEMGAEIRRCHHRIDELLVANNAEFGRRRHAELRAIAAESCRALEEAVASIMEAIRKQA